MTSPGQPSSRPEERQASRPTSSSDAGPGGDLEVVVAQDPDRRGVDAQRPHRLVDDHPEQLLAVVRRDQAPGDAEDGVEALGELDLEGSTRQARRRHRLRGRIARWSPAGRRNDAMARRPAVVGRRGPSGTPGRGRRCRTHATSRWWHRRPFRRPAIGPERRRTYRVPIDPGSLTVRNGAGTTLRPAPWSRSRITSVQLRIARSAPPVDDGPSPMRRPARRDHQATRSAPPPDG